MIKYILFLPFLLILQINFLFATSTLEKIQMAWQQLFGFQAQFEQVSTSTINKSITATGLIQFKKPNLIRWEYYTPDPQLIIVGEKKIWIYDSLLNSVNIQNRDEILQKNVFDYLSQKQGLQKNFTLVTDTKYSQELKKNNSQIKIYLKPNTNNLEIQELHLLANKNSYLLEGFLILDFNSQINKFYLKDININVEFRQNSFEFIPKKGMEIIK